MTDETKCVWCDGWRLAEREGQRIRVISWVILFTCIGFAAGQYSKAEALDRSLHREAIWAVGFHKLERECRPERFEGNDDDD